MTTRIFKGHADSSTLYAAAKRAVEAVEIGLFFPAEFEELLESMYWVETGKHDSE